MEKKLYRNTSDQAIAGVAAGLARYLEIDVTWIRIFFILATIFGASGLLIYIILFAPDNIQLANRQCIHFR